MSAGTSLDAGHLLPRSRHEDPSMFLEPELARQHHHIRASLLAMLEEALPTDYSVSGCTTWVPTPTTDPTETPAQHPCATSARAPAPLLQPDLVVHSDPDADGRLSAAPVLCIEISTTRAAAHQHSGLYARHGVDHHWLIDLDTGAVEVSVRVGGEFRHAETVVTETTWVDFGAGVVLLDPVRLFDP